MAFPISIDGTLSRPKSRDASELTSSIVNALHKAKATSVSTEGDTISFKAGIFRLVTNWNVLVPVGSGTVFITDSEIKYHLSLVEMLACVTSMVTLFFGPVVLMGKGPIFVLPVMWLWLVGGNYVLTLVRFPSFLTKALEKP